jgi:hypothetical protein
MSALVTLHSDKKKHNDIQAEQLIENLTRNKHQFITMPARLLAKDRPI